MADRSNFTSPPPSVESIRARRLTSTKWHYYEKDVIPAWVADMDFELAPAISETLSALLARSDIGYPSDNVRLEYFESFSNWMSKRFHQEVNPGDVEGYSDVVQAIYLTLQTATPEGSGVVFFTPSYPPFYQAIDETKRQQRPVALIRGRTCWEVDWGILREQAALAKGGALLLCSPHNPTGKMFSKAELFEIAEIALRNKLLIISDEIHQDLVLDTSQHIPICSLSSEIAAHTLTLTSGSKTFNLAGLRAAVGYSSSPAIRDSLATYPQHFLGGPSLLGMVAQTVGYLQGEGWLADILELLAQNRGLVTDATKEIAPLAKSYLPPQGTYLAWLDLSSMNLEESARDYLLRSARVGLSPGEAFLVGGESFVRLNFATPSEVLAEMISRMKDAIYS